MAQEKNLVETERPKKGRKGKIENQHRPMLNLQAYQLHDSTSKTPHPHELTAARGERRERQKRAKFIQKKGWKMGMEYNRNINPIQKHKSKDGARYENYLSLHILRRLIDRKGNTAR